MLPAFIPAPIILQSSFRLATLSRLPRIRQHRLGLSLHSVRRPLTSTMGALSPLSAPPCTLSSPELTSLSAFGHAVLTSPSPTEKIRLTNAAAAFWSTSKTVGAITSTTVPSSPARPALPKIVGSGDMPTAKAAVAQGFTRPVYLLHALAHVELNAIDLAWDTALRFGAGMPEVWFSDFLRIAVDEARHFGWLRGRLEALGESYGALPAHRIVWDAADVSQGSRRDRLALGQLCQEARGLDAGPRLALRLEGMGDKESAAIVRKIAGEEVAHVEIGVRQFVEECERDGVGAAGAVAVFHEIALRLSNPGAFAPPFNVERRAEAGLMEDWYMPVAEEMRNIVKKRHADNPRADAVAAE